MKVRIGKWLSLERPDVRGILGIVDRMLPALPGTIRMSMTAALRGVALLSVLCSGCSGAARPLAPSPVSSWPQLSGNYTLTLTPCELPVGNDVASNPVGPYQSIWTFTQQEDVVTGVYSSSSPPTGSSGTLTGRVGASGEVAVANLRFSWSSSHVGLLQFSASGGGVADKTQVSGTVAGEESFTAIFGGIVGSRYACAGTSMPFRFTRRFV
jgi:hypothetical protein